MIEAENNYCGYTTFEAAVKSINQKGKLK